VSTIQKVSNVLRKLNTSHNDVETVLFARKVLQQTIYNNIAVLARKRIPITQRCNSPCISAIR